LLSPGKENVSRSYTSTYEWGGYRPRQVSSTGQNGVLLVAVDGIHHHILNQSSSCIPMYQYVIIELID